MEEPEEQAHLKGGETGDRAAARKARGLRMTRAFSLQRWNE
ncbi:hypothetical protein ASZ90_011159 [hydrocarbon metagenome]|uniref:Uncharacterized protein n=1 Tax=hydrocarbon metagenome TaxID=938273 RepID=A0A0W8FE19_9ZZZZ|nr:hypothetical protein [Methanomicrobiaceae archaeon]